MKLHKISATIIHQLQNRKSDRFANFNARILIMNY